VFSAVENVSAQNPNGYAFATSRRPDVYGWRPWGDALASTLDQWGRVMIWAPSGSYGADPSFNYPYQFASHWLDDPESAAVDDPLGLPVAARVGEVGLWWGYSVRVATRWNPTLPSDVHPFDPDNPADLAAAYLEVDTAARAGATRIGLDSFAHYYCPAWKLHRWLRMVKARHPQIHFVSEAVASDILHNEDPTYLAGYNFNTPSSPADLYPITTPHYLADFVNPGHEMWIGYQYSHQADFGMAVTPALVESDARRFASWGYVPVMFNDFTPGPETLAAESWRRTVPADLQQAVQWNTNYDRLRAVAGPDGRLTIIGGWQAPDPGRARREGESAPADPQSGSRSTSVNSGASTRAGHNSGRGGGGGGIGGSRSVPSPGGGGGASGGSGDQGSVPAQNGAPPQPAARPADAGPAAPMPTVPEFVPRDVLRKLIEDALKRAKAQQAGQPAPPPTPAPGDH